MENKTYTLTIEGQNSIFKVENLTTNGTNYVSETKVDTTAWPPSFKLTAKDEEGNITEAIDHAKLIQQEQYAWDGGKWYLAFAPISPQEIENVKFHKGIEDNTTKIEETNDTALAGLMATTDLYEELLNKGVL